MTKKNREIVGPSPLGPASAQNLPLGQRPFFKYFAALTIFAFLTVPVLLPLMNFEQAFAEPAWEEIDHIAAQEAQAFEIEKFQTFVQDERDSYQAERPVLTSPTSGGSLGALPKASNADVARAQAYAKSLLSARGWGDDEYACLVRLWQRESGWRYTAHNKGSGAYGIPQALPGKKMASAGADWQTNPETQIRWGLGYVKGRYGTPCGAWGAFLKKGWY